MLKNDLRKFAKTLAADAVYTEKIYQFNGTTWVSFEVWSAEAGYSYKESSKFPDNWKLKDMRRLFRDRLEKGKEKFKCRFCYDSSDDSSPEVLANDGFLYEDEFDSEVVWTY